MKIKSTLIATAIFFSCTLSFSQTKPDPMKPQPFKIAVPQSVLDNLNVKIKQTRWPDEAEGAGWSHGVDKTYLKELTSYWLNEYDWRKHEALLNQLPQFTVVVDGVSIHYIHVKGKGKNPKPLLLTHGWPDSFYRFHKVISMLTNPGKHGGNADESFDVVIPSVPGFGFSERVALDKGAVANLWAKLMTDVLGYKKFVAAGGDVGSSVTKALALKHPSLLEAIHLTDVEYPTGQEDFSTMTKEEQEFAAFVQQWWYSHGAYGMIQMSKPQSLAFSLTDSPVGWAAWTLSFGTAGAPPELLEKAFGGKDEMITNIMIYWVTETIASSMRMYLVDAHADYAAASEPPKKITVPVGIAVFPREAVFPKEWAERSMNVARYTKMPRGGHFAALEEPELFASELRSFFYSK